VGENAADNGGLQLAYAALMHDLANHVLPPKQDGFYAAAVVLYRYAQIWCQNTRDAEARRRAVVDPHSPGEFRVKRRPYRTRPNSNRLFSCKAGERGWWLRKPAGSGRPS